MFLLKRFDQVVWTVSLESVLGGSFNLECEGCEGNLFIFPCWCKSVSSLLSSSDSRPAVLSTSEMGVIFIPPVIILSPALWALDS